MKNYDAIIIGTGIGGSGIGALLTHAGWKVLMLEKNAAIGGRVTSFQKDGFTVDLGMHNYLADTGPLGDICRQVGTQDEIEWIPLGKAVMQFGDQRLDFNRKGMVSLLPENERDNLRTLFNDAVALSAEDLNELWYVPLVEWVDRYTKDPIAHMLIDNMVSQYLCVPSTVASTAEFLVGFQDVINRRVMYYPKGGNISISKAYMSAVEKYGGEVKLSAPVKKIIIENGAAVGVVLKDGSEFSAPAIISNADIRATVKDLVGEAFFPKDYAEKIRNLTYSTPAATLKVLLKEKVIDEYMVIYMPDTDHPTYRISEDMERGKVPKWVGAVSFITSNVDPSLAPPGKQCVSFVVGCPTGQDWVAWEKMLLNNFYRVHPQAKNKVLKHWLEDTDWLDKWAGKEGAIIGVGQTVDQVHEKRPSPKSPIKGLYYSSADVGRYRIGTGLAAAAAKEVFRMLTKKVFL